jgi:hypothetical protein
VRVLSPLFSPSHMSAAACSIAFTHATALTSRRQIGGATEVARGNCASWVKTATAVGARGRAVLCPNGASTWLIPATCQRYLYM